MNYEVGEKVMAVNGWNGLSKMFLTYGLVYPEDGDILTIKAIGSYNILTFEEINAGRNGGGLCAHGENSSGPTFIKYVPVESDEDIADKLIRKYEDKI